MSCCILLLVVMTVLYFIYRCCMKEGYKRHRRQGIRMGWKRGGRAGHTLAMKGTRFPKLPKVEDDYYQPSSGRY